MNKILSLVIFTVALIWTWNIIHSSSAIGFETHSGIQEKMAALIMETLQSKKPNAKNVRITRLWTETLGENKVRAVFAYRFMETADGGENMEQTIEGEAILHREPSDDARLDKWVLQKVQTTNDSVIFENGAVVTPVPGPDEEAPPAAQ